MSVLKLDSSDAQFCDYTNKTLRKAEFPRMVYKW